MKKTLSQRMQKKINKLTKKVSDLLTKNKREKEAAQDRIKFYSSFVKKGDLVFDVGAHTGNRVEAFLAIGAKVIAVEPQESCSKILRKKFGDKISVVQKGLGEKAGKKRFYVSSATTLSTFSDDWMNAVKQGRFKKQKWSSVGEIEITTLDELIKKSGNPDFVKIDVEGYETEVLSGLSKPVKMLSYEYTVPETQDKALECLNKVISIDSSVACNYSVGESMEFAMNKWVSPEEMKKIILSDEFVNTGFGDIYIKKI